MFAHKSLRAFQVWVNVDLAMNKAQPEDGADQYDGEGLIFMPKSGVVVALRWLQKISLTLRFSIYSCVASLE